MKTFINNAWETLSVKKNGTETVDGVIVQRAFGGIRAQIGEPDENGQSEVIGCIIDYWQRELYPNGDVIKVEAKTYVLMDLDASEVVIDDVTYTMTELLVLTGFVNALGYSGIINPARQTLADANILPIDKESGYPLRRDTRPTTLKP